MYMKEGLKKEREACLMLGQGAGAGWVQHIPSNQATPFLHLHLGPARLVGNRWVGA